MNRLYIKCTTCLSDQLHAASRCTREETVVEFTSRQLPCIYTSQTTHTHKHTHTHIQRERVSVKSQFADDVTSCADSPVHVFLWRHSVDDDFSVDDVHRVQRKLHDQTVNRWVLVHRHDALQDLIQEAVIRKQETVAFLELINFNESVEKDTSFKNTTKCGVTFRVRAVTLYRIHNN